MTYEFSNIKAGDRVVLTHSGDRFEFTARTATSRSVSSRHNWFDVDDGFTVESIVKAAPDEPTTENAVVRFKYRNSRVAFVAIRNSFGNWTDIDGDKYDWDALVGYAEPGTIEVLA